MGVHQQLGFMIRVDDKSYMQGRGGERREREVRGRKEERRGGEGRERGGERGGRGEEGGEMGGGKEGQKGKGR